MKQIKKGTKANTDGIILTKKEYDEYKKLKETIGLLKMIKQEYNTEFRQYLM